MDSSDKLCMKYEKPLFIVYWKWKQAKIGEVWLLKKGKYSKLELYFYGFYHESSSNPWGVTQSELNQKALFYWSEASDESGVAENWGKEDWKGRSHK